MNNVLGAFGEVPFSTKVLIWLALDGQRRVRLSHASPDWVIAIHPRFLPACDGRVVVSVDGEEFAHDVHLVNGMSKTDTKTCVRLTEIAPF